MSDGQHGLDKLNKLVGKKNTDRKLWTDGSGNFVFVTEGGAIGICSAGSVVVMPMRDWVKLAGFDYELDENT